MMKKITFFKAECVDLFYYPASKRCESVWNGFASSSDFRNAMDVLVNYAHSHEINSMLTNTLNQSPVSQEDLSYAAGKLQILGTLGVQFFAFVMPTSTITKLGVKRFTSLNNSNIVIGHFSAPSEASTWLDQQIKPVAV